MYSLENDHIVGGGRLNVNVIHARAGPADGLHEALAGGQHVGGDLGVGAHNQGVVVLRQRRRERDTNSLKFSLEFANRLGFNRLP